MTNQPASLEEIIIALEATVEAGEGSRGHEAAAERIAYNILYGNNAVDVRQYFDEYPELVEIAELALEFDWQTDKQYLNECWGGIVRYMRKVRTRYDNREKRSIIKEIISDIEKSLARLGELSREDIGANIVGYTWGRAETWEHDDLIMKLSEAYPALVDIADIAADLEIPNGSVDELWRDLLEAFGRLKQQVAEQETRLTKVS